MKYKNIYCNLNLLIFFLIYFYQTKTSNFFNKLAETTKSIHQLYKRVNAHMDVEKQLTIDNYIKDPKLKKIIENYLDCKEIINPRNIIEYIKNNFKIIRDLYEETKKDLIITEMKEQNYQQRIRNLLDKKDPFFQPIHTKNIQNKIDYFSSLNIKNADKFIREAILPSITNETARTLFTGFFEEIHDIETETKKIIDDLLSKIDSNLSNEITTLQEKNANLNQEYLNFLNKFAVYLEKNKPGYLSLLLSDLKKELYRQKEIIENNLNGRNEDEKETIYEKGYHFLKKGISNIFAKKDPEKEKKDQENKEKLKILNEIENSVDTFFKSREKFLSKANLAMITMLEKNDQFKDFRNTLSQNEELQKIFKEHINNANKEDNIVKLYSQFLILIGQQIQLITRLIKEDRTQNIFEAKLDPIDKNNTIKSIDEITAEAKKLSEQYITSEYILKFSSFKKEYEKNSIELKQKNTALTKKEHHEKYSSLSLEEKLAILSKNTNQGSITEKLNSTLEFFGLKSPGSNNEESQSVNILKKRLEEVEKLKNDQLEKIKNYIAFCILLELITPKSWLERFITIVKQVPEKIEGKFNNLKNNERTINLINKFQSFKKYFSLRKINDSIQTQKQSLTKNFTSIKDSIISKASELGQNYLNYGKNTKEIRKK